MMQIFLILCLVACIPSLANADIFKYRDADGRLYITDKKLNDGYRLVSRTRSYNTQITQTNTAVSATYQENIEAFSPHIKTAAIMYKLDPRLIHAIVDTESSFNPKAYSKAGAVGLMQLMPETAKQLGVKNSWNPQQNIRGGAQYLRQLMDKFNQNIQLSLAAYNAGEGAVKRAGNAIPNYPETKKYVQKVILRYTKLKQAS